MSDIKLCINCKHSYEDYWCLVTNPRQQSLVTGEWIADIKPNTVHSCENERESVDSCGKEARYFEPK